MSYILAADSCSIDVIASQISEHFNKDCFKFSFFSLIFCFLYGQIFFSFLEFFFEQVSCFVFSSWSLSLNLLIFLKKIVILDFLLYLWKTRSVNRDAGRGSAISPTYVFPSEKGWLWAVACAEYVQWITVRGKQTSKVTAHPHLHPYT